jgi:hypothetical protein
MPNQSAAPNVYSFMSPPPAASDPVPVMRREITMLRFELEQMRAMEDEARKTNQLLIAYIDYILENQYQWQREAERLSSLMKKRYNKSHWSLFSWRKLETGLRVLATGAAPFCQILI